MPEEVQFSDLLRGQGETRAPGAGQSCAGAGDDRFDCLLPLQPLRPSPRPRPPRIVSDWPSAYTKAVSISVWPRFRKACTDAALEVGSMRRPISKAPSTVAGRADDMMALVEVEEGEGQEGRRIQESAALVQRCLQL